jgi:hypothetical protein
MARRGYSSQPAWGARRLRIDCGRADAILISLMDELKPPSPKPATSGAKLAARRKREADALRANLRKRKDQVHARDKRKPTA